MTFPQSIFTYYLVESKTFGFELLAFCNLCIGTDSFLQMSFFSTTKIELYMYILTLFSCTINITVPFF